jgi:hypothetical protein
VPFTSQLPIVPFAQRPKIVRLPDRIGQQPLV